MVALPNNEKNKFLAPPLCCTRWLWRRRRGRGGVVGGGAVSLPFTSGLLPMGGARVFVGALWRAELSTACQAICTLFHGFQHI